jgi:hypothetical protein
MNPGREMAEDDHILATCIFTGLMYGLKRSAPYVSLTLLNNVRDLPKMIAYSKELNDFLVQFLRQQIDMMHISCSYLYLHDQ